MFYVTFDPVWPAIGGASWVTALMAVAWLAALSLWAYLGIWGASDRRLRAVMVLRLLVVLLFGVALFRPAIVYAEKSPQSAALIVLADRSRSMLIGDALGGQTRWQALVEALQRSQPMIDQLQEDVQVHQYGLAEELFEELELQSDPSGSQTAIGAALQDAYQRHLQQRILGVVLLSDGAERYLTPRDPARAVARYLAERHVPIYSVGFGEASLSGAGRDIAVRDVQAPGTIFVKNQLQVQADLYQRGFQGEGLRVRLQVEDSAGRSRLVQTSPEFRSSEPEEQMPVRLHWVPQIPGEYKLTVAADPLPGEAITKNNEFSTFVTVLKGGLGVLYLEGTVRPHEPQFIRRALDQSPDIRADRFVLLSPADARPEQVPDEWFRPGQYDVYLLGNLDADHLDRQHWNAMRDAVEQGAGLMMIGGYHSFGPGGHAETALADVLPIQMHPLERQRGPEPRNDMHFFEPVPMQPTVAGLSYIMRISTDGQDRKAWESLPPLDGANRFEPDKLKLGAQVLAESPGGYPLLVAQDVRRGRVLAFAGDTTWRWWLAGHEEEHIRFWRQAILWLVHKDEAAEGHVRLALNQRRFQRKQRVEITATAEDAEGQPVGDARFEVVIEAPEDREHTVPMHQAGPGQAQGYFYETDQPGDYRARLSVTQPDGQIVGSAQLRFLVYDEDLEWDNPADLALLQDVARQTQGRYVPPEGLPDLLEELHQQAQSIHYMRPREITLWDRWPFFLLFVALLSAEWFLRKRSGLA